MKHLLLALALAAIGPAWVLIAASTPAEAHRVCNEWGQCWWHPDWNWGEEGWRWRGDHGEDHEGHEHHGGWGHGGHGGWGGGGGHGGGGWGGGHGGGGHGGGHGGH